jgi:hypothetical protein
MLKRLFPCLLAFSAVTLTVLAMAEPDAYAQQPDMQAARGHYMAGRKAMDEKRFGDAVKSYVSAYDITKDPSLFKQIADAYYADNKKDEAGVYYRRYLAEAKAAPDAEQVKARIAEIDAKPTEPVTDPDEQPLDPISEPVTDPIADPIADPGSMPPSFSEERGSWKRTAGWISVGVAAVLLTTGAVLGTSAMSREEDIDRLVDFRDPTSGLPKQYAGTIKEDYEDKVEEGDQLNSYASVAFIGAGVFAVAATVFFILNATSDEAAPTAAGTTSTSIFVGPNSAGIMTGWEF